MKNCCVNKSILYRHQVEAIEHWKGRACEGSSTLSSVVTVTSSLSPPSKQVMVVVEVVVMVVVVMVAVVVVMVMVVMVVVVLFKQRLMRSLLRPVIPAGPARVTI